MKTIPHTLPKFLWFYCSRHKLSLVCLIGSVLLWAASVSLNPYLLKLLIDSMSAAPPNAEHLFSILWLPASFYVSLTLGTSIVLRFYDWIMLRMFPQMKKEITSEMFSYLANHSYSFFQQNFAGNLANKVSDITKSTSVVLFYIIDQFLTRFFSLTIGAMTMFFVHPYFTEVFLTWSLIFITISVLLTKKSQHYSESYSSARSLVVGKMVDSISNILNIKLFAREKYEHRYLQGSLDELVSEDRRLQWFLIKVKVFYSFSITLLTALMLWLLIEERSQGHITIGDFALILTLTMVLVRDIFLITNQLTHFSEELGTCKQALSIIFPQSECADLPHCPPLRISQGTIGFDSVHFTYRKNQNLFVDQSVTIHGGQKVGIVGLSGSGKTTFVNLILRFFDVHSGTISIDGQNIKEVAQESLRSQIAMIPQDPFLFHRSLMENIRYGRLDATDDEVIESAKKAHCHEFITMLKDGYASLVGERGIKLSGGQRQCIGIARAILKNAPILILDEATSSLDSSTELAIQKSMSLLMQGKTSLVIAHRLSTLFHMDRILVFSEGRIVEDGTHAELIDANGHYQKLWNIQVHGHLGKGSLI